MRKREVCHDCGAKEGELHYLGCDMERCPFCGGQLISCSCRYTKLGFNYNWSHPTCGLPVEIYENGLPPDLDEKWQKMLNDKGRVPFIWYPFSCAKCGKLMPDLFQVSDQEWEHYIEINERKKVICKECYDFIKQVIDENSI